PRCARVAASAAPSSPPITSRILRVISAAAFSVKVMARIWLTSATGPSGRRRCTKRRASTAVFPEPAPARTAAEPATSIAARCSSVGTQLSGTGRLLLERRTLVAADGAVWAVRVAGLGIDVEASRARAPDQRRDERRPAVRIRERPLERPLHDALDRPSPRLLLGVLADDEGVHGRCNPSPGDVEEPGVLGNDGLPCPLAGLRDELLAQRAGRRRVGRQARMGAGER